MLKNFNIAYRDIQSQGIGNEIHALSINGKRKDITRADLLTLASSINVRKAEAIIHKVSSAVDRWPDFAKETGASAELRDGIRATLTRL